MYHSQSRSSGSTKFSQNPRIKIRENRALENKDAYSTRVANRMTDVLVDIKAIHACFAFCPLPNQTDALKADDDFGVTHWPTPTTAQVFFFFFFSRLHCTQVTHKWRNNSCYVHLFFHENQKLHKKKKKFYGTDKDFCQNMIHKHVPEYFTVSTFVPLNNKKKSLHLRLNVARGFKLAEHLTAASIMFYLKKIFQCYDQTGVFPRPLMTTPSVQNIPPLHRSTNMTISCRATQSSRPALQRP